VVSTSPLAKFTNVLRVQTDSLSTNLIQAIISETDFGNVYGGREDSELGLGAHLEGGFGGSGYGCGGARSLGDDKVGSFGVEREME
jgi:hypothetical protein